MKTACLTYVLYIYVLCMREVCACMCAFVYVVCMREIYLRMFIHETSKSMLYICVKYVLKDTLGRWLLVM